MQARMSSTRLPGKVMLPVLGKSLLERMMERLNRSKLAGTIVVATTQDGEDDVIAQLCADNGWNCFRGDKYDLLDRHYQAAKFYNAGIVLKIPSDCPLIDHRIIDEVIKYFLGHDFDFVSNLHPATYPDGNDVEVMTFEALEKAWREATRDFEREHTTPYIWEHPEKFSTGNFVWPTGRNWSMSHRFTIDYPEDYAFIKAVFDALYPDNPDFSLENILDLLEQRPDIYQINAAYAGVNWYRHHLKELHTIDHSQTKMI